MNDPSLKLPIWQTAISGYGDGIGALFRDGRLFRYFIYASALTLILIGGQLYVSLGDAWMSEPKTPAAQMTNLLFSLLVSVAYAIAVSPLTVALHRKLLLGEAPNELYLAAMFRGNHLRVAVATMAVYGLFFIADLSTYPIIYLVYGVNPLDAAALAVAYAAQPTIALVVMLLTFGASLLAALISARFAFAFPAIATDAPGASLGTSFATTRGSTWRLFFVFLLIVFFLFVAFVIAVGVASVLFVIGNPQAVGDPDRVGEMMMLSPPFLVVYAIAFILMMAGIVAIGAAAARAYEIRVNRGMTGVAEVFA
jgi:hypothetical protein